MKTVNKPRGEKATVVVEEEVLPIQEKVIEEEPEPVEEVRPTKKSEIEADGALLKDFWDNLLSENYFSKEGATKMLPFVMFLAVLGMVYISSHHFVAKNIREMDKLSKEVKELSWDYKTLKADLMLRSTLSNVSKRADSLGLKEAIEVPQNLKVKDEEQ